MGLLKRNGASSAAALARSLKVSAMAVRQHLYMLQEQRLVAFEEKSGGVGRPLKQWRLTKAADHFFPDAHAELAVSLVNGIRSSFGKVGLEKIVLGRTISQIASYNSKLEGLGGLQAKIRALARFRTDEGYMAEVVHETTSSWLLIENHCPICSAASVCTGLCSGELEVFSTVLGPGVRLERTEHLLSGSRRCTYRITTDK